MNLLRRREFLAAAAAAPGGLPAANSSPKPKVRAVTAFITLDRSRYDQQLHEALKMLRQAQTLIREGGYEVETIRITTQPFPAYAGGLTRDEALRFFAGHGKLAGKEGFAANMGPAMVHDGDDPSQAELLAEVLCAPEAPNASLVIAGDEGIYWNAVRSAARLIKFVSDHSPGSAGNFNFAATAMLRPYCPFFPGSYHLDEGRRFSIGTEGANVVDAVFAETRRNAPEAVERLSRALGGHAVSIEKAARQIEKETGWMYMGIDATPAPLGDVSIGGAIEKFTGDRFGASGTMTAAAIITRAVQAAPVKHAGYSGLMAPVLEDVVLARRWSEGTYGIDALLSYSAVCGTGLDTVPMPGDVTEEQIERILGDVATLAFKWRKPLSARLLPIKGKKSGEQTTFSDPRMGNTTLQPIR